VDFMAAAEGFMGVVAISAAVAVMGGMAVGIEVAGMGAAGTEAVRIGMVVLPIGGGIIHTPTGLTVGKSWFENRKPKRTADGRICGWFWFSLCQSMPTESIREIVSFDCSDRKWL